MRTESGFGVVEAVMATALIVALTAALLSAVQAAPDAYAVHAETVDMYQRARIAADALFRDLVGASGVRPYRWGGASSDPPGSFRPDAMTAVGATTTTYWLKTAAAGTPCQLMSHTAGAEADVPVVDHVALLRFEYFDESGARLEPEQMTDGPWMPDASDPARWDADLARVRSIDVSWRVQSAVAALRGPAGPLFTYAGTAQSGTRWAPDVAVRLRIAPRNLNLGS